MEIIMRPKNADGLLFLSNLSDKEDKHIVCKKTSEKPVTYLITLKGDAQAMYRPEHKKMVQMMIARYFKAMGIKQNDIEMVYQ